MAVFEKTWGSEVPRVDPLRLRRIFWLDFAKGIGIILVCLGHTIGGLRGDKTGLDLELFNYLVVLIYSFHMPLFFFLSGVVGDLRPPASFSDLIRPMFVSIIVPYVIWSCLFVVLQNFSGAANRPANYSDLLFILWRPIAHFWFFYALFAAKLFFFAASAVFGRKGMSAAAVVCGTLYVLTPAVYDPNAILMGCTYYGIGLFASSVLVHSRDRRTLRVMLCFATTIWIAWVGEFDPQSPRQLIAVFIATAGISMTVALSKLLPSPNGRLLCGLAQIGEASLAIFVSHVIFAACVRYALLKVGVSNASIHVVLGTFLGVFAPTGLFVLANWTGITPFVGFGRTQKRLYWAPAALKIAM